MKITMPKPSPKIAWGIAAGYLIAYEGYAMFSGRPDTTLSEAVWEETRQFPYVSFFAGLLCGHLFWQRATAAVTIERG